MPNKSHTTSMAVFRNGIRSYLPSCELYAKSKGGITRQIRLEVRIKIVEPLFVFAQVRN
jgi:hypothetical protein